MGRKRSKRSDSGSESIYSLYHQFQYADTATFSAQAIKQLHSQISDALQKIYKEYLQDFTKRKQQRLIHQRQTNQLSLYKLVIEPSYRNELTQKVKQLVHLQNLMPIYHIFHQKVYSFMKQIYSQLNDTPAVDEDTLLGLLAEALHTVNNSAEQLSNITQGIFLLKPSVTCEQITKTAFLDYVVKPYENMIFSMISSGKASQELKEILNLTQDVDESLVCSRVQKPNKIQIEEDMNLEDIVAYIQGRYNPFSPKRKRRQKSRASGLEEGFSHMVDLKSPEVDRQVEEFKAKLKQIQPDKKLVPRLSNEWILEIRNLINNQNDIRVSYLKGVILPSAKFRWVTRCSN